ncbi:class D sortase [Alicyclobacillus acidocaldarius]|uniref:Sortase family protein n=1 Tax=Alicyclobacillus acidocaldarius (strain Tc-4-1) TaxID=1048834 RepID=F8IJ17_ALIAT|nr:class D sortase [Alicyclobacillus acidocaldarius]AEJ42168.1 sortase family protein [Alicyclobacillus acidocaldarius subsp. acidocaldarius Tc-4-1]
MKAKQMRRLALGARAVPLLLALIGAVMAGDAGWAYLWETAWVNHRPLPAYQPGPRAIGQGANDVPLWMPPPQPGRKIGELVFPAEGVRVPVVQGDSWADLALGAGHDPASALPGQGNNVYVAGHRDTVFHVLSRLHVGDLVEFETPYGTFTYQVTGAQIVPPTDTAVTAPTPRETLTLQTCWPFDYIGFAPLRYIVHTRFLHGPRTTNGG